MKNVAFAVLLFFGGCMVKDGNSPALRESGNGLAALAVHHDPIHWYQNEVVFDTILPSGCTIAVRYTDDYMCSIKWNNPATGKVGTLKRELCFGNDCPYSLGEEFRDYIGIRGSCVMAGWSYELLPKNNSDSIVRFFCDLASDAKRGYLLCCRCEEEDTTDYCLYDVNKHKHHPFQLPDLPETGHVYTLLDTIQFVDRGVRICWNKTSGYRDVEEMKDTVITF